MKSIILSIVFLITTFVLVLNSCKEKVDDNDIEGRYRLIETLSDPGNGSGTFMPVTSSKLIQFYKNGIVSSNGQLVLMDPDSNNPSTGTYSVADSTIKTGMETVWFRIIGNELIISYPCIEPCKAKFIKQ